jgi:hypothetical protein
MSYGVYRDPRKEGLVVGGRSPSVLPPGPPIVEVAPVDEEALVPSAQLCQGLQPCLGRSAAPSPAAYCFPARPGGVVQNGRFIPPAALHQQHLRTRHAARAFQSKTPWFFRFLQGERAGNTKDASFKEDRGGVFWLVWAPPKQAQLAGTYPIPTQNTPWG